MKITDEKPEDEITNTAALRLPQLSCGWCGKLLRAGPAPISTGICSVCASKMRDAETRPAWKDSLGRLGKAQARLWHDTPLAERLRYLALVDAEIPTSIPQPDGDDGRTTEEL